MLGDNADIESFSAVCEETQSALLNWFKCDLVALSKLGVLSNLNITENGWVIFYLLLLRKYIPRTV